MGLLGYQKIATSDGLGSSSESPDLVHDSLQSPGHADNTSAPDDVIRDDISIHDISRQRLRTPVFGSSWPSQVHCSAYTFQLFVVAVLVAIIVASLLTVSMNQTAIVDWKSLVLPVRQISKL